MDSHANHRRINLIHSAILVLALAGLLALFGWALFGQPGIVWMVLIGMVGMLLLQRLTPHVLMQLYEASPLKPEEMPHLHKMAAEVAHQAGLRQVPRLYYIPSRMLNAFAVGADRNASIGLTDGMIRGMNARELTAVLAHETAHIAHNDMWVMNFADVISRLTFFFSGMGKFMLMLNLPTVIRGGNFFSWSGIAMLIVAPAIVNLLQLALSRAREYDADVGAIKYTGDPHALASALQKLECGQDNLFWQIIKPGDHSPGPSILRTHPHVKDRIARLAAMTGEEIEHVPPEPKTTRPRLTTEKFKRVLNLPRYHYLSGLWF